MPEKTLDLTEPQEDVQIEEPTVAEVALEEQSIAPIVLTQTYSFYKEDGTYLHWSEGDIVEDATEIRLLTDRKAPIKGV